MYADRAAHYKSLEEARESKLLVYVTGDRRGAETQIGKDVRDYFVHHLDRIGVVPRISFLLYTAGGDTLAAWNIANLVRLYCDELEMIIPARAQSAGTLISLAAKRIVMTKQATLGPIDPSVNTVLNPQVPGAPGSRVPVSVEGIMGFIEFAKSTLGADADLVQAFQKLAEEVHPLVLGQVFRTRSQIRMLATKLMADHIAEDDARQRILDFLCSESGSHDYTINRREARDELGLPVVKPSVAEYETIKAIYDDFCSELLLNEPFEPLLLLGPNNSVTYNYPLALIESVGGGSHSFRYEGELRKQQITQPGGLVQVAISDNRQFQGWRHADAT